MYREEAACLKEKRKKNCQRLLNQLLSKDLVDGFALLMIRENSSLKASFHRPRDNDAPSKMIAFSWHQIVHPGTIITSLKILELNLLLALINISRADKEVFQ
jgi:hypothetical protein